MVRDVPSNHLELRTKAETSISSCRAKMATKPTYV